MGVKVADTDQRLQALDPTASFIVQAPAGSGKTGLLTQRFLKLLAHAQHPEEIIAITFTKKAAAEMRARIFSALQSAQSSEPPDEAHERLTWQLAQEAMAQDKTHQWALLSSPSRLRIMTIDALSAWLGKQLPVVSQFGAYQQVSDSPQYLYRQAVHQTIQHLEAGVDWSDAVERLIAHLDNNLGVVESLLMNLLARREQWLRHTQHRGSRVEMRQLLEQTLAKVVDEYLLQLHHHLTQADIESVQDIIRFAAQHVEDDKAIAAYRDVNGLPEATAEYLPVWLGLVDLLLTAEGKWRKQVSKTQGFPAPSSVKDKEQKTRYKENKERFITFLNTLNGDDTLLSLLAGVRVLPATSFSESQWRILEALFEVLPVAVAELYLVFSEHGTVDFSQVEKSAIEALGEADNPTDLALVLDYQIRHIMVDEFQDTSYGQFQLLERLTAGWSVEDGRTLFLVGDPMQSIYRFREAEVGFFLWAQRYGIGHLKLTPLHLRVNFRSQQGVVDWVNQVFTDVFPAEDDIAAGAVAYSASSPIKVLEEGDAVEVFPFYENDSRQEALAVVEVIEKIKSTSPEQTIAIIVQARNHLNAIVQELKRRQLSFQAIDVDLLSGQVVIQDMAALTRALLHPGDNIAWFTLLRSPWCGLTLDELAMLAHDGRSTLWSCLQQASFFEHLSSDAQQRVQRFKNTLTQALHMRGRCSLSHLIESTWLKLGGPASVEQSTELNDAMVFLRLIETLENAEEVVSWPLIEEKLSRLFAKPDANADNTLQLMTIHKSKGLEFDHVLLPGLGKKIAVDEKRLLMWMERPSENEAGDLLLAPLNASGESSDSIYQYLRYVEQGKQEHESARLLYVAATRAKKKLYLFGHTACTWKEEGMAIKSPQRGTMLAKLWPSLEQIFIQQAGTARAFSADESESDKQQTLGSLKRLSSAWFLPTINNKFQPPASRHANAQEGECVEFSWATPTARYVGTLVHFMLMKITQEGIQHWTSERVVSMHDFFQKRLLRMGVAQGELSAAVYKVERALLSILDDERGRWILYHNDEHAHSEYAITGKVDNRIVRGVIDRTFVDEQGQRWIVDYKTGEHQGGDVEVFLDEEKARYQRQLEQYAVILQAGTSQPIHLGLYFPLMQAWREWIMC